MHAKGMASSDIEAHIQDIYGISISDSTVSRITDKILPVAKEWQQQPLEPVYAVVFLDAIHYHVRSEGQIVKKAVYIAIGVNLDGRKDVLGMWVGENESAKFWATVLNSLRNWGGSGYFHCLHGQFGGVWRGDSCQLPTDRASELYHPPAAQFQQVCVLQGPESPYGRSEGGLCRRRRAGSPGCSEYWDKKYPKISQSWRANWANLSTYFKYPQEVRRLIYTTNAIEGFNRQLRKVTKAKSIFPTDDSLLKMLYLATMDITKKWTGRRQDWSIIHAQMVIYFANRMPD